MVPFFLLQNEISDASKWNAHLSNQLWVSLLNNNNNKKEDNYLVY